MAAALDLISSSVRFVNVTGEITRANQNAQRPGKVL